MNNRAFIRIDENHPIHLVPWREERPGLFERRYLNIVMFRRECQDCRISNPMDFAVKDDVWKAAGLVNGLICPTCLEKRLSRSLTMDDLKDCGWKRDVLYWCNKFSGKITTRT